MMHPILKRVLSPALDPLLSAALLSRLGDLGAAHRHGSRARKLVALTFDDGPVRGGTEEVLDALAEHGVHATFFCIGANALQHPELIRRAAAAGHVIGAHSMHHSRLATVSPTDTAHIDDCVDALRGVLGRAPALYRPPWGWLTPWEMRRLRQRGLAAIRWDVETADWRLPCPGGETLCAEALPRVYPGSILVFHDGASHAERHEKPQTVAALRRLIPELRAHGYRFVTIPELLSIPAYQLELIGADTRSMANPNTPASASSSPKSGI